MPDATFSIPVQILIVTPLQTEADFFRQACIEQGFQAETTKVGKLPVTQFPELGITLGVGGLGKTQFAVQTQHLIDVGPGWDLVICVGAAGALVDGLAVGDIVVATETVEHDIRNRFGKPSMPRFPGGAAIVAALQDRFLYANALPVHFGPVASGDEDVIEVERRQEIQARTGALVVAWEGAGGARACQFSGIPYLEIRGVTDGANGTAAADFATNLEKVIHHVALLITSWIRSPRYARYQGAIVKDDRILLIRHTQHGSGRSYWVIPGGGRETGETESACVAREMFEETNLTVEVGRFLVESPIPNDYYQTRKTYLCTVVSGQASPGYEPEEDAAAAYAITEVAWFDLHSEESWEASIFENHIAYPLLQDIRRALGYV